MEPLIDDKKIRDEIAIYCDEKLGLEKVSIVSCRTSPFGIIYIVWNDETKQRAAMVMADIATIEIYLDKNVIHFDACRG